jgi:hypothetical protein
MIQFNELRISPDSKYLIVDVSIKEDIAFNDYNISEIRIYQVNNDKSLFDNVVYDKIITDESIAVYINGDSNVLVNEDETVYIENGVKRIRLKLSQEDLNTSLSNSLFMVQIKAASKKPALLVPDARLEAAGVVIDLYPYYKDVIKYIKDFDCSCENKNLIDSILKLKALELSAKTGRFEQVAYYWFKYFSKYGRLN